MKVLGLCISLCLLCSGCSMTAGEVSVNICLCVQLEALDKAAFRTLETDLYICRNIGPPS